MRILGVFQSFDPTHPLWHTFQQWIEPYEVDWISLNELKESFSIQAFDPDVIITDQFALDVETLKEFPTIFYLVDYLFDEPKESIITKLALANAVYTCSIYLSKQIKQHYSTATQVCLPHCCLSVSEPKNIVYDEGHPFINELHVKLPRENFVAYGSIEDLNTAKIFLPIYQSDVFDNRICMAICKQVPVISEKNEYVDEFLQPQVSGTQWVQTIKSVLRDRAYWVNKLKTFSIRYGTIEHMENHVRKVVKDKISRKESVQRTSFTEISPNPVKRAIQNRRKRAVQLPQQSKFAIAPTSSIFLSGGIGDVLALESYMSDEQREILMTICYGTNKQAPIEQIFRALPNYTSLKNHQIAWNDFSKFWCFLFKRECGDRLSTRTIEFDEAEDWGIMSKFPKIKQGLLHYNNSSLIINKLCSIDHIPLPVNYYVISPYSSDKRIKTRDFGDDDWAATIYYLIKRNKNAVVLNSGNEYVPNNPCLINLSGKTSFIEAVEVLKKANGYIGIDSSLSVLAAKIFEYPNLIIKSRNDHCYSNKHIYYAPHSKFNFMNTDIAKLIPKE